jgi:signal transduction histidine kinase
MDLVKASRLEASGDRAASEPDVDELTARDDTVLVRRERSDRGVERTRPTFDIQVVSNVGRAGHDPMLAGAACRRTTGLPRTAPAFAPPLTRRATRPRRILARVPAGTLIDPEPWDDDPKLTALLGEQGARALRALFDPFPDAIGLLWAIRDDDGRLVDFDFGYGNPAIMRLFDLPRPQAGRFTLLEALPQMREDGSFEHYARVCDTGEPFVDEITYDTAFGEGWIRGTLLRRTAKLGDGLLVLVMDVTEQRRMEAELRDFADIVAHDLREPVTGIAHLVTLLERRADTPPDPAVLGLLRASTERGRALIDGVLAYARAGELRLEPVDLTALMDEVAADLRPGLADAGATLEVGALPEVRGDARQLRRLLQNLVSNAVRFRGAAAPRIAVTAREGAEHWVVTVADNGIGVAPEDQGRIFGMFARAHRDHDGTGIGLAVCRRVAEAHGGRIWVERADGGGSAFSFTLPR